jgi:nitrous oxidase accessory protein NosD
MMADASSDLHARTGSALILIPSRYRLRPGQAAELPHGHGPATDSATGEPVFLKWSSDGARIEREAEILALLDHPGIVRLRRQEITAEGGLLVLDLIQGADLERWLASAARAGGTAWAEALLAQLAYAVAAIHAAGVLHRDLKPANIVVRADGTPVIVDFGAAALIGTPLARGSWLTDGYAAPEQYGSDQAEGPWTDLYALGAIGHRLLAGKAPPAAPARLQGAALALPASTPGALRAALAAALQLEPDRRPASCADWRAGLAPSSMTAAAAEPAASAPASPLDDYPPTVLVERAPRVRPAAAAPVARAVRPRRRRGVAWLAVGLLGIGAAAAGLTYGPGLYERYVKTEWLVDPAGGGDATTIADALGRARADATITVRAGSYAESLVIAKPVRLVAAAGETPLVAPPATPCVTLQAPGSTIAGLRFQPAGAAEPAAAPCLILAASGRVERSEISHPGGAAVRIEAGAAPALRQNVITASATGIIVTAGAGGEIASNTLTDIAGPSLVVRGGASPALVENTIETSGPAVFAEGARGRFERNRVTASRGSAVVIASGADPDILDNLLDGPSQAGIYLYDHGRGRLERNAIRGSKLSAIVLAGGADARISESRIEAAGQHGVLVVEGARAVLRSNRIRDSAGHGIALDWDVEAVLEGNLAEGNAEPQVLDARLPEPPPATPLPPGAPPPAAGPAAPPAATTSPPTGVPAPGAGAGGAVPAAGLPIAAPAEPGRTPP